MTAMTTWITGDISLTQPLIFDHPTKNVVILGKLSSEYDITFKVQNLVVFGELNTTKDISIKAEKDFFNSGSISGNNVKIVADGSIYNSLNEVAIERIRALGVDITQTLSGRLGVRVHLNS